MRRRVEVRVCGIVQGVGFRPFVYRAATERGLTGWVCNDSSGVQDLAVASLACASADAGFSIRASVAEVGRFSLVSPDVATCPDCLRELRDPSDRRHGYAFLNCTNCGPRYTIVRDIAYGRARTTMAEFTMCTACRAEFEDPSDRRFHAQPTA